MTGLRGNKRKEREKLRSNFSLSLFSILPVRRHFVAEQSEARNLLITLPRESNRFPKNKCAVRHKILVETKSPRFSLVPLGTNYFITHHKNVPYGTFNKKNNFIFYRYEVPNGTTSLFERNLVGLSYYGSHSKCGVATM